MALLFVPSHVNETTEPVDNLGGILSVVLVGALILAINFMPVPNEAALALGLSLSRPPRSAFVLRQRRAKNPLYDLHIAARRIFWVAACAGIIVFGSLMGGAFMSQQYLQNVLGYSTLQAGAAILPAASHGPRRSAVGDARRARGSRFTLLFGYVFLFARVPRDASALERGHRRTGRSRSRYVFIGAGVGSRRDAGLALADRLRTGDARRHGVRDSRSSARPGRRDHAVDLRRAAHSRVRSGDGRRSTASGKNITESTQAQLQIRSPAPRISRRSTRSTRARSPPRRSSRSSTATLGVHRGRRSPCARGRARLLHVPEARRRGAAPRALPRRRTRRAGESRRRTQATLRIRSPTTRCD